ncbi:zinc-dependent alcohol dehydrogenase [Streptomyces sp. NPDC004779]
MTPPPAALATRELVAAGARLPVVREAVRPAPGPGELRLRTRWTMISPGTELHYLDRSARTGEHFPLGYCAAGTVESTGPGTPGFAPGDQVIAMGWGEAVHADVVTVPHLLCRPVPAGVDLADAVVANLAATAVHAVDRAGLVPEDEVAVVGAGMVGLLVAQTAAALGCRVLVRDLRQDRLATAEALGLAVADGPALPATAPPAGGTGGRCVMLCGTGDMTSAVTEAARWAASAPGRPRLVGVGRFSARIDFSVELGNLDVRYAARCGAGYRDPSYARGLTEAAPAAGEHTVTENLQRALDLVASGAITPAAMKLPRFTLDEAAEAYTELRRRPPHPAALFHHPPVHPTAARKKTP